MAGMMGSLVLVSVVLLAIAPDPLPRQLTHSLLAVEPLEGVFRTETNVQTGRWNAIYVHHSLTTSGDVSSLAVDQQGLGDHFLIGNGEGAGDGEILVASRWLRQQSPQPVGLTLPGNCISICLVGDFDEQAPTSVQVRRLGELIQRLQDHLGIPTSQVYAHDLPASAAGIGRYFPRQALARYVRPGQ
jgi:hypothetical protein